MTLPAVAAGVALLASVALAGAQSPPAAAQGQTRPGATTQQPGGSRTPASTQVQGTGRITGRVISTEGRPLRGAQVYAMSAALRRSSSTRTDADGRFEVKNLPPAEFTVMASKPGYVGMYYGAKRGGGAAGRPVRLADGQTVEKIDFQLPRACAITGRVLDEYGEPAGEAGIEPMKAVVIGGRRRLMTVDFGNQTDDLGQFRVFGLDPGDYFVRATLRGPYGAVSEERSAYPPTFYPGVTVLADALRVACRAGQETPGVQMALAKVPTASVSGTILDSQGRPGVASVMLMSTDEVAMGSVTSAMVRPDGKFTLSNVVAGTYKLVAMSQASSARTMASRDVATAEVHVGGQDVAGLVLQLAPGATVHGKVVADGDAPFDFPLSRVRIGSASDPDDFFVGSGSATAKDDGTFEMTGLLGNKRLQVYGLPDTWAVKTIRSKNGDAMEQPTTFLSGETVDGFEVVLTNRISVIQGTVTDDRNRPVKEYTVGIFSENPAHWGWFGTSGRSKVVRADENGRYDVKGLLPGRYMAVAMSEIDSDEWVDSEFLERLLPVATAVTIAEGETKTLELKLLVQ